MEADRLSSRKVRIKAWEMSTTPCGDNSKQAPEKQLQDRCQRKICRQRWLFDLEACCLLWSGKFLEPTLHFQGEKVALELHFHEMIHIDETTQGIVGSWDSAVWLFVI